MKLNKTLYYILSFTWGIIVSLTGLIISGVLLICGFPHYKNAYGWGFTVGKGWGGFSAGPCCVTSEGCRPQVKSHEFGHSV